MARYSGIYVVSGGKNVAIKGNTAIPQYIAVFLPLLGTVIAAICRYRGEMAVCYILATAVRGI